MSWEGQTRLMTHFITLNVELQPSAQRLHDRILAELQKQGEPLRWTIVSVDQVRQIVSIEAVITTSTEFLIPDAAIRAV